jgi:hypothetical protein
VVLRAGVLAAAGVLLVQVVVALGVVPPLATSGVGPGALVVVGAVLAAVLRALVGRYVARRVLRAGGGVQDALVAAVAGAAAGFVPVALLSYGLGAAGAWTALLAWLVTGLLVTVVPTGLGAWWTVRATARMGPRIGS